MHWNYYGSGHGKGEWDGAGAVVKRALRNEQLLNPHRRLQNAADCILFLDATMAGQVPNERGHTRFLPYPMLRFCISLIPRMIVSNVSRYLAIVIILFTDYCGS